VANGVVYVGADRDVYALNSSTGTLLWRYPTGFIVQSSPAVVNGRVFVGSEDHNLYSFNIPTFFNTLGSPGNVYRLGAGWIVSGTGAPVGSFTAANEFQPAYSGNVSQIDVAVSYVSGVNSFYVPLNTDNAGQPDTMLASWGNLSSTTNLGSCGGLVSISGISGLSLTAGSNYWIVIGPTSPNSTTWEAWNLNSTGLMGLDAYSNDGGGTWIENGQ
jgi:hypothetical protein